MLWFGVYDLWLHPNGQLDNWIISIITDQSNGLLSLMGYEVIPQGLFGEGIRTAGVDGSHGVWVGDPCNGLTLFALFSGFVLAFPGKKSRKLWFIPLGLISIHLLNVLRVTSLALVQYYAPQYLEFNHTYTFTILVYSYVFGLWYLWAAKLSRA